MPTRNLLDWIALTLLPGLGPVSIRRLLDRYGDPHEIAYRLPTRVFESMPGIGRKGARAIAETRRSLEKRAARERRRAEKLGVRLLIAEDPDYPAELESLHDPPPLLYLTGELTPAVVRVAVVGSRRATFYGQQVATGLACGLAARGIDVVSGGARGIDSSAHRGALAEGGRTVAVLGCGFLHPYPPENEELFDEIAGQGAVLTEFPLDQGPRAENFPRRNRLISGLSAAVVVVEADPRSGSLITAGHALEQGREVLAVPGPVSSPRSQGCHRLIQQGAKLIQNVEDILEELSPMYRQAVGAGPDSPADRGPAPAGGTLDEEAVLELLGRAAEPIQIDDLADRAPFGIARLQAALFGLEVSGAVVGLPGGHYAIRPGPSP